MVRRPAGGSSTITGSVGTAGRDFSSRAISSRTDFKDGALERYWPASLSSNAGGFKMRMAIELTSPQLPTPLTANASGVVDVRDRAASMGFAMNLGSDPQVIQVIGSGTLRMQMVLEGGTFYLKLPPTAAGALPLAGKQWLKLDVSKLKGLPGLSSLGGDPTFRTPAASCRCSSRNRATS